MQAMAFRISALVGFLGVALGAFGAHGLKDVLTRYETAAIWDTAVLYHLVHAVMLALLAGVRPWRRGAWWCFLVGIVIFSGSLYVLGVTGFRKLGMVTPFGGVFFLVGWAWLVLGRGPKSDPARSGLSDG